MIRVVMLIALIVAGCAAHEDAVAGDYTFTVIAEETSDQIQPRFSSIDDQGNAYFLASPGGNGASRLYTGNGTPGSLTQLGVAAGLYGDPYFDFQPVSNSGLVGVAGYTLNSPSDGIFRVDPATDEVSPVIYEADDFPTYYPMSRSLAINDAGVVAFGVSGDVYNPEQFYTSLDLSTPIFDQANAGLKNMSRQVRINNSNQVLVGGTALSGPNYGYPNRLEILNPDGSTTIVADYTGDLEVFGNSFDLNNHGDVVFGAAKDAVADGIITGGIYTWHNGVVTLRVPAGEGALFDLNDNVKLAINDSGQIAFLGTIQGNPGIYTGPDPVADRVIASGDPLLGSILTNFTFVGGLNNSGQIVFTGRLADGRLGVFRADPVAVPEPSSLILAGLAIGTLLLFRRRRSF